MRIFYLAPSSIISDSANSVHVMKMCQALSQLGHQVELFAAKGEGSDGDAFAYYGVAPCFALRRFDERRVAMNRVLFALRRRFSLFKIGSAPSYIFSRAVLRHLVQRDAPDLVYARHRDWLLGLPAGLPFIYESHRPPQGRIGRSAERALFDRPGFRGLVVISSRLRDIYLAQFPGLRDRIVVAHDAADDWPSIAPGERESGFHVGYVGHLYAGRGVELICDLARAVPAATFHLVGGTEADRRALLGRVGLLPNLVVHGHKPPSALPPFYGQFDLLVAPYQRKVAVAGNVGDTSEFMSPLKIFEYMAAGKPMLCSDLPVLREVLGDDRNAVLLPPDDVGAWADGVRSLMNDPERRRRLGETARAEFLSHHTWEARARKVLEALVADAGISRASVFHAAQS